MVHILQDEPTIPQSQVRVIQTLNSCFEPDEPIFNVKSGYKTTISILNLPLETQGEIFIHAHGDNSNDEALLLPVEVILSHVCSEWRNIAIHIPILWTAFKFDSRRRASAPIDKLEEYLLRSKTQLLELYFNYEEEEFDEDYVKLFVQLVEIGVVHAERWRRFTLFTDVILATFECIRCLEQINAPNLEYFAMCLASIGQDQDIEDQGDISPSVLTEGAPKLSIVRIDASNHFNSLPPLSNLTILTIQDSPEVLEYLYSFHTFRSILMIPTLTNLSIESSMGLERLLNNPDTHSRIFMPSLKTFRITRDNQVLGILSLLDAPLLETLVLHDLDLISLYIGQDMRELTPFKKLDTIALLDCRFDFRGNTYVGPLGVVIIYELAHCATRVIISSPNPPPSTKNSSNLLNFERCKWPRLQCITLDLSTFSGLVSYVMSFEHSPHSHSLTVRVVEPVLKHWREVQLDFLTRLEKICKLESMKAGDPMMDEYWPAPGGIFQEDGNLKTQFNWGETIRARGLLGE